MKGGDEWQGEYENDIKTKVITNSDGTQLKYEI